MDELLELQEGVRGVYNENIKRSILFKAHLICGCGDMPGIGKIFYTTGYGGIFPCRFCNIKATWNGYYYVPLSTPVHNVPVGLDYQVIRPISYTVNALI
jgi:hypothetical protein